MLKGKTTVDTKQKAKEMRTEVQEKHRMHVRKIKTTIDKTRWREMPIRGYIETKANIEKKGRKFTFVKYRNLK